MNRLSPSTKPLIDPISANHQWGLVAISQEMHKKPIIDTVWKWVIWELLIQSRISRGPMSLQKHCIKQGDDKSMA